MSCLLVVGWRLLQGGRSVGRSVGSARSRSMKPFRFPELLTQEKQMKRASTLLNLNRYEIYFIFGNHDQEYADLQSTGIDMEHVENTVAP